MGNVTAGYSSEVKTLCNLGLTLQQAKVYLALAKKGQASMKELSEAADIDRGECYRIVSQLLEKRLISKVISSPIQFQVISFNSGVKTLLEQRKNEVSALEENIDELLEKVKAESNSSLTVETEESIRFVPISPAALKDGKRRFVSDEKSVDILTDFYRCESVDNTFIEEEKKALRSGVKFRMLISDPNSTFNLKRLSNVRKLMKEPNYSIRVTSDDIAAPLAIHDNNQVEIYISKETHISKSSPLITNNERMVKLVKCYFDNLWKGAREIKLETSV